MTDHLKAKGEALAAEIELTCQTIAVFARYAYGSRECAHLASGGAYLNIGLDAGGQSTDMFHALRTVRKHGGEFYRSAVRKSDTEDTLIVQLVAPVSRRAMFEIASDLNQEAIAQCMSGMVGRAWGELVGPKAEAWGAFDPERFLLLDGRKLTAI